MRSPTTRLSALTLAAIVAPVTIVVVLGYVSLRQWQSSAELLFREQARDVATMAAEKVEMMLRLAEDAVLDRLQAQLAAGDVDGAHAGPDRGRLASGAPTLRVRARRLVALPAGLARPRGRPPVRRHAARWHAGGVGSRRQARGAGRRPGVPGRPPAAGAASPCSSPTRGTPRPCAATFSRRRWPRWSRRRSWPCSIRMGARSMRGPPSTAPSRCWRCRCARGCRTGAWRSTRRRAPRRTTSCGARSCSSPGPSGCWWPSSSPASCSRCGSRGARRRWRS